MRKKSWLKCIILTIVYSLKRVSIVTECISDHNDTTINTVIVWIKELIGLRNVVKLKWVKYKILDVKWLILAHEQDDTEGYFFFSEGSNGACKNEFVFQFTCLQPHFYIKIHVPRAHISTKKWWWTTF